MTNDQTIRIFAVLRGGVGASAWLTPRLSARLLGADAKAGYPLRLFGVRDAALAYGLATSQGAARAAWLRAGIACDLADAAASLIARRRGELPLAATVLATGAAVGAVVLGAISLQGERA